MYLRTYYPTVVLLDIHLGSSYSRTEEVTEFLKSINCDRLILNGDIIDGWQLQKGGSKKWKSKHTDFFKVIMKMMENFGTEVIYVRGNHDDFLDSLAPMTFYNVKIVKEFIYTSHGRNYYVTHGDIFDTVTTRMKWLSMLGDMDYTFLLWINK
ncbi:MAG: metallophosphoesterase, partial [Bacteroides sp.]|nr:metallophosphoesterase [Bacteroides sp.]